MPLPSSPWLHVVIWPLSLAFCAGICGLARATEADGSAFDVAFDKDVARSDIGAPILSFAIPGLDQWWEGQYEAAAAYSGTAALGYVYADRTAREDGVWERERRRRAAQQNGQHAPSRGGGDDFGHKDLTARKYALGLLAVQGSGGLSAYHAFRTAARTRQARGQYGFLGNDEPLDLLAAPFHFGYLERPSTFIPLAIIGLLSAYQVAAIPEDDGDYQRTPFTQQDAFFTSAYSYNAGTHEEALFRGWMMPVIREYSGNDLVSNVSQSLLFAAAHLGSNPVPIPQLLLGYHLGNVTQDSGWHLGEAVFIHVWWDVLAFAAQYHYKRRALDAPASARRPAAAFWLPPLQLFF